MAENISVSVRIRPLNQREHDAENKEAWRVVNGTNVVPSEHNPRPGTQPFAFDHVRERDYSPTIAAHEARDLIVFCSRLTHCFVIITDTRQAFGLFMLGLSVVRVFL